MKLKKIKKNPKRTQNQKKKGANLKSKQNKRRNNISMLEDEIEFFFLIKCKNN
jgi:hypothetical protein